jgi:hypothetical protein
MLKQLKIKRMKVNILLALLVAALGYVTCKGLKKTAEPTVAAPPQQPVEDPRVPSNWYGPKASYVGGENPDGAGTFQVKAPPSRVDVPWNSEIAKPSTSRRAFMASGWWTPIMAVQPSDTTVNENFKGKWLKFKEDQTFEIHRNGKLLETAHWGFDDDNYTLYLSCQDPYFNNTWKIQERGFRMILKGNTDLNVTGMQIRMDNAPSPNN